MKKRDILLILLLIIVGFIYRIYLSSLATNGIIWDMSTYHQLALDLLSGKMAIDCCQKNMGYSIFLATIYYIFGPNNIIALRVVQILLDLTTGILICLLALKYFGKYTALISLIIYITNPLTSSYTGLRLPETITIFYISLLAYFICIPTFMTKKILWLVYGLLCGLLLITRMQFYYFIFVLIPIIILFYIKKNMIIKFILIFLIGFFAISSYTLAANYINFNKLTLMTPYHNNFYNLYSNFYNDRPYPELTINYWHINPKYADIFVEYWDTPLSGKDNLEKKYKNLFLQRIKYDWPIFLNHVAHNIVWLWDKDHLYTYTDPFYPKDSIIIRIYNVTLVMLFIIGLFSYIIKEKYSLFKKPLFIFTILLLLYVTFMFSLVSNESRHTIVFYSLLILWAGYGISELLKLLRILK